MPAERGLKYLLPFYCYWRWRHAVPVHYLVVGGWLPAFLDSHPWLCRGLRRLDSLHVQSRRMIAQLKRQGFENLHWLPNFRDFLPQGPVSRGIGDPVRLVFLSRMIPEKGADLAVAAVETLNAARERPCCTLDLYGPVADDHHAWLSQLLQSRGDAIAYRGSLAPDAVIETLSRYDALLFPTRYVGEGFPGVIVEAYAAGLAVIASDWQDNGEVVIEGTTGLLFPSGEAAALEQRLDWLIHHSGALLAMKRAARATAARYHVDTVIPELLGTLEVPVTPAVGNAEEVPQ
ncbi:glycosyltransferase family 4 protein [Halomonas kalidii]|uniref:Glycosyltransferase family 4 protein n=1 Tax=Halomonas kalidii TaxID=3043293 RepID=A0ABT6VJK5_9GAMM|nr:glycosyltransferase family 4 protein [Halomonas kalidii]MDI5934167.1 glycosyltransferase family 4 protein [Halomonas kalidii]